MRVAWVLLVAAAVLEPCAGHESEAPWRAAAVEAPAATHHSSSGKEPAAKPPAKEEKKEEEAEELEEAGGAKSAALKGHGAEEEGAAEAGSKEGADGEGEEGKEEKKEEEEEEEEEGEGEEEGEEGEEGEGFSPIDINTAAMLLGGITFVMLLFLLVNFNDDDVRRYAWAVISNTISIFMAVLFFQGNNQVLVTFMEGLGWHGVFLSAVHFLHCVLYLAALFVSVAVTFGICSCYEEENLTETQWMVADALLVSYETPVNEKDVHAVVRDGVHSGATKSVYTDEYGMEIPVAKKQLRFERVKRDSKAWATLFAHMGGFAAIAAGGSLQQYRIFKVNPVAAFVPVLINTAILLMMFQMTALYRHGLREDMRIDESSSSAELRRKNNLIRAAHMEELASEAEDDILSLAVSFLTVQAVRFAITGQLPNEEGVDLPMQYTLQWQHCYLIWGIGIVFVVASIALARLEMRVAEAEREERHAPMEKGTSESLRELVPKEVEEEEEEEEETEPESILLRVIGILMNACAMSFAWCIQWGARWAYMLQPMFGTSVHSILGRIELAMVLSFGAFVVVCILDRIDDSLKGKAGKGSAASPGHVKMAQKAISSVVTAISVLVGFSWEHSFDGAVGAVASLSKEHSQTIKFVGGIAVFFGLLWPWKKYILKKAMQLEELKEERERAAVHQEKEERRKAHLASIQEKQGPAPLGPPPRRNGTCCPVS